MIASVGVSCHRPLYFTTKPQNLSHKLILLRVKQRYPIFKGFKRNIVCCIDSAGKNLDQSSPKPKFLESKKLPGFNLDIQWRQIISGSVLLFFAYVVSGGKAVRAGEIPGLSSGSKWSTAKQTTRTWRDSGIDLAFAEGDEDKGKTSKEADGEEYYRDPEEVQKELIKAFSDYPNIVKQLTPMKTKGKKLKDPYESMVADPSKMPEEGSPLLSSVASGWRPDKLKEMTYTQLWMLTREYKVDKVRYAGDKRSVFVTTKPSAPGGVRTERVGIPFDPDLYDHLCEHGVDIEIPSPNPAASFLYTILRVAFPFWFALFLIRVAFSLGRRRAVDRIFGGARLELVKRGDVPISFKDVAGVDQVKEEIMEIVTFLRYPQIFIELGAQAPQGILLVGPPGTGKTLLAKAIAGEAGVPFFSAAGTEFVDMFVGVGASRVRDMFDKARKNAPCILFIDEFDGVGKSRSSADVGANDESVTTINQLLTEMDGFENNTGVVVMAATNRPAVLDKALLRPGRFDRIIHLPLPNVDGRVDILRVHCRDKEISPDLDLRKIARATSGFTGADIMYLMNQSGIIAVRNRRELITESDVFDALEQIRKEKFSQGGTQMQEEAEDIVPPLLRRQIAIYEAGKILMAYITPGMDDISRVALCPNGVATAYTQFIPQEEHLEANIVTTGYMEGKLSVHMAGRTAERMVLGEGSISSTGGEDLDQANIIAREMIFRLGLSTRMGPVSYMAQMEEDYLNPEQSERVLDMSVEMAELAREEMIQVLNSAEAKSYFGLAVNYEALEILVACLLEREELTGDEVAQILDEMQVYHFTTPFLNGFGWQDDGSLIYPQGDPMEERMQEIEQQQQQIYEQKLKQQLEQQQQEAGEEEEGGIEGEEEEVEEEEEDEKLPDFDELMGFNGAEFHPMNPYKGQFGAMPNLLSDEVLQATSGLKTMLATPMTEDMIRQYEQQVVDKAEKQKQAANSQSHPDSEQQTGKTSSQDKQQPEQNQ